jgi:hypothetical protein
MWFGLLRTAIAFAFIGAGGAIAVAAARHCAALGSRSAIAAEWVSLLFVVLSAGLLLADLATRWSCTG